MKAADIIQRLLDDGHIQDDEAFILMFGFDPTTEVIATAAPMYGQDNTNPPIFDFYKDVTA